MLWDQPVPAISNEDADRSKTGEGEEEEGVDKDVGRVVQPPAPAPILTSSVSGSEKSFYTPLILQS